MVDHITNNDILTNNSIKQQQELLGIEKKSSAKNPYQKVSEYMDQSDISDEALKLYDKEKDVEKYREMVLEAIGNDLNVSEIVQLINNSEYMSDTDLADSLSKNKDFMDLLFSE
ncbi:MAG: hypothetical protein A2287_02430 [Candidatus Melainabacteria bacterium RIFOXYA12_FULL_32_12]|nr:MAG: hypothetical protein A2104_05500 [Candidatus Melainabacteria bacterium GWF2_32_7]OGI22687.1 MAG: hypothetical protein A2255_08825 [Candidatus Melainabacteria bacterium RIFOXYA2_FULL_32_9]OGI30942.1 MAG: hypothetical protein A2287_02430 [Candidatus Melainabacteria bacterium RIFOXYA12_FULL_32_12]